MPRRGPVTRLRDRARTLHNVEIELKPDPPEPIRRAILTALADARGEDGGESRWWRAGIDEAVEPDEPQA
jgi:hypothetical protein